MNAEVPIILLLASVLLLLFYLLRKVNNTQQLLQETQAQVQDLVQSETRGLFAQLEAYLSLRDRLGLDKGLPYTKDWSAAPDFLKLIVEHCLEARPRTVLECSSGLTTLMLARCCELNRQGRVYSLENGAEYADKSRGHIRRYGLDRYATVIHAPLERHTLNGVTYEWYALDGIPDSSIEMLVIDGPPGFIQRHSRYPALPLLFDKLADGCVIFMDDAARGDEQEIVAMWQAEYPMLEHEYINTERGCAVLILRK